MAWMATNSWMQDGETKIDRTVAGAYLFFWWQTIYDCFAEAQPKNTMLNWFGRIFSIVAFFVNSNNLPMNSKRVGWCRVEENGTLWRRRPMNWRRTILFLSLLIGRMVETRREEKHGKRTKSKLNWALSFDFANPVFSVFLKFNLMKRSAKSINRILNPMVYRTKIRTKRIGISANGINWANCFFNRNQLVSIAIAQLKRENSHRNCALPRVTPILLQNLCPEFTF